MCLVLHPWHASPTMISSVKKKLLFLICFFLISMESAQFSLSQSTSNVYKQSGKEKAVNKYYRICLVIEKIHLQILPQCKLLNLRGTKNTHLLSVLMGIALKNFPRP